MREIIKTEMDKTVTSDGNGSGSKTSNTATSGLDPSRFRKTKGLINEDFCAYCKEGGNLLNCDRCPSSFHFLCHEPPLDPDDIPKGEFLCNKCDYETLLIPQLTQVELKRYTDKRPTLHHNDLLVVVKKETDSTMDVLMRMAKAFNPGQMRLSKGSLILLNPSLLLSRNYNLFLHTKNINSYD